MGEVEKQIDALPPINNLPPGVERQAAGDSEIFAEMFGGFAMAMVAGIFCVYGVLLLLFNHASQPITILVAVPLAAAGAFGALLITGLDISLSVLIGLILLIGIAVKNSILLVDYAVMAQAQGPVAPRRPAGRLPQARPPRDHDHPGDGRGHDAHRARFHRRFQLPHAARRCSDRRPDHVHRAQPDRGAGGVHAGG